MNDLADPEKPIHPATKWFLGIIMVLAFLIATAVRHGGAVALLAALVLFLIGLSAFALYEVLTFPRDVEAGSHIMAAQRDAEREQFR